MLRKLGARRQVSGVRFQASGARPLILSILSGILLSLPFSGFNLWIFAWFAFLPLFFALENKSGPKRFLLAYLSGVLFWSCTVYWLIHVTLAGAIILVLYLGLYFGIFGLLFTNYRLPITNYLFLPSAWVLLEYIRSYLFTGFPWALLGYSQYRNLAVIQFADITGVWGVSFLVMMVNLALLQAIGHRPQALVKRKELLLPLVLLTLSLAYGYFKSHPQLPSTNYQLQSTIKVSVIQGNIPQELKWRSDTEEAILDKYLAMTEIAVLKDKPDLAVWPEASFPGLFGEDLLLGERMLEFNRKSGVPLLAGAVVWDKNKYFNSALLLNEGRLCGRYDKVHLVPFGEYVPLKELFPFLATVVPIGDIEAGKDYAVFQLPTPASQLQATSLNTPARFSVLICFEDLFPELSRAFVNKGADFLINITNDAWYKKTSAAYQHLAASVFRAVENRVFLVRAANTGVSCFISPTGKIFSMVSDPKLRRDIFVDGFRTGTFRTAGNTPTIYSRFGDFFVGICFLSALYGIISGLIRRKR